MTWTFGKQIRAARQMYYSLPNGAGLLRISDAPGGFFCELRPLGSVLNDVRKGVTYRCWWELAEEVVEASPYLRKIEAVTEYTAVILGEDGQPCRPGALI